MSLDFASLKWGRIVIGVIVGFVVALAVNLLLQFGYGVVLGFQARGMPPQDQIIAAVKSLPFQVMAALFVLLGGFVGGRIAARSAETNHVLAGLITGILLAILAAVWRRFQWGAFDLWMAAHFVFAMVGGWVGGWIVTRQAEHQYEELPSL